MIGVPAALLVAMEQKREPELAAVVKETALDWKLKWIFALCHAIFEYILTFFEFF